MFWRDSLRRPSGPAPPSLPTLSINIASHNTSLADLLSPPQKTHTHTHRHTSTHTHLYLSSCWGWSGSQALPHDSSPPHHYSLIHSLSASSSLSSSSFSSHGSSLCHSQFELLIVNPPTLVLPLFFCISSRWGVFDMQTLLLIPLISVFPSNLRAKPPDHEG